MQYKAIFFDLDGTLLPLEQAEFSKTYFYLLSKTLLPHGLTPETTYRAVMAGVERLQKSDGTLLNADLFWQTFAQVAQLDISTVRQECDAFYNGPFTELKAATQPTPISKEIVRLAKQAAGKVVLATNPVFPLVAQTARMGWLDLTEEDFDWVTHYDNSYFVKPNPNYYLAICEVMGVEPADCLMVGNDEKEDMYAASKAGLRCLLLTDNILPSAEHPWQGDKCTRAEFLEKLKNKQL